jgi:hypothetical protein
MVHNAHLLGQSNIPKGFTAWLFWPLLPIDTRWCGICLIKSFSLLARAWLPTDNESRSPFITKGRKHVQALVDVRRVSHFAERRHWQVINTRIRGEIDMTESN